MEEIKIDILKWHELLQGRDKQRYQQFIRRHLGLISHLLRKVKFGKKIKPEKLLAEIFFLAMAEKGSPDRIASFLEWRTRRIIRYNLKNQRVNRHP